MRNTNLTLTQWETRVADFFHMVRLCHMTHTAMLSYRDKNILNELHRKQPSGRAVYTEYVKGYVGGLEQAHIAALYRYDLEFCYLVDGVLYSTHKGSSHRSAEEFYDRGEGNTLANSPCAHYWRGTDKPFNEVTV